MVKLKFIVAIFFFLFSLNSFCQWHTAKRTIPDSLITLNKGIYLNIYEFLNNSPGIPYPFEVVNTNPDYLIAPDEKNDFYLTYCDVVGIQKKLKLSEIWGYYDGFGIFVSYARKPFELLYLGAFSVLRYEHHYDKNIAAQTISLLALGATATSVDKVIDIYFDLKNDIKYPYQDKYFKILLSKDADLYNEYKADKKTSKYYKSSIYLLKYNQKHPVSITEYGISVE